MTRWSFFADITASNTRGSLEETMNKMGLVFGTTTALFAGLTLYYANELAEENARVVPEAAVVRATPAPSEPSPSPAPQSAPIPEAATPSPRESMVEASVPNTKSPEPEFKMSASDIDFLALYADPQGRRTLIEEALVDQRISMRGLAERLGLTAEHWQRVLEVFAEQQVESRAASLRCRADPACKSLFTPDERANQVQQVRDVIGEDKFADYDRYVKSMYERQTIAELQKQLRGNLALPADRAEALIAALAEERAAALRELSDNGDSYGGIGVPNGFIYYNSSAPTLEARMESGVQYSQRMRDRAATLLNANQQAAFNQMQDQLLATLRAHLVRQQPPPPKPPKTEPQKIARS
jgi:hypothetical protein